MKKKITAENDAINPKHYTDGKYECIDVMEDVFGIDVVKGFCLGNSFKYLWRHDKKGKPVEDLKKSIWYTEKLIEVMERKGKRK